jgi:hypothetical protein
MRIAVGTSHFVILLVTGAAVAARMVDIVTADLSPRWNIIFTNVLAVLIGGQLGARLAGRLPEHKTGRVLVLPDDWAASLTPDLPSNADHAIMTAGNANPDLLGPAAGLAIFVGYIAALLGTAAGTLNRRDASVANASCSVARHAGTCHADITVWPLLPVPVAHRYEAPPRAPCSWASPPTSSAWAAPRAPGDGQYRR